MCDLYCAYFSPEVVVTSTRGVRGLLVTLIEIEIGMHLITCTSGQICLLTELVSDRMTDCLIDWVGGWMADCLTDRSTY